MGAENKTHEDFSVNAVTPCSYKRSQVIADMALILLFLEYTSIGGETT